MHTIAFHELIANVGLLFLLGFVYELGHRLLPLGNRSRKLISGLLAGSVGILIMSVPFDLAPGIVYDTRTILVSVTTLTFGPFPGIIAMAMTTAARLVRGGPGAWVGTATIVSSYLIGLFWHLTIMKKAWKSRLLPVFLMGVLVHAVMLAWQLLLPENAGWDMLRIIWLPVMLIDRKSVV